MARGGRTQAAHPRAWFRRVPVGRDRIQLKRLQRDRTRPLLQRADREQVLRELALQREPLYREVADLVMDTDGLTAADAATRLCLQLASRWSSDGVAA